MKMVSCGLILLACLGGCQSRQVVEKPRFASIPQSLTQACVGVFNIPDRDLSQAEIARGWATDRRSLGDCKRRHGALAASVSAIGEQGK